MNKLISSSVYKKDFKKVASIASELGCGVEISRFKMFLTDEEKQKAISETKKSFENFDGELTLHGHFFDLNVASRDPEIERVSIMRFEQALDIAVDMGMKTVLFHSGYNAFKHRDYQKQFREWSLDFWKDFIKKFEKAGVVAVIENVLEETPEKNLAIIETINSPNLKLSLDIGHANVYSKVPVIEWIKAYKKYLYHMHIHNNFGDDDSHFSVLNGTINFRKVVETLIEENLSPKIVFEIFKENELRESVNFFNKLCKEIVSPVSM